MITVQYFASNEVKSHVEFPTKPSSPITFEHYEEDIIYNLPIFNYASFYNDGIDLFDPSIELGETDRYYGVLANVTQIKLINDEKEPTDIKNASIVFKNNSCKKITVLLNGNSSQKLYEISQQDFLPLVLNIPINSQLKPNDFISIYFDGFPENAMMSIQGLYFGDTLEFNEISEFNSIFELNPIGTDLAINETNLTTVIEQPFIDEEGQKIVFYDNNYLLEDNILKKVDKIAPSIYNVKSQSALQLLDSIYIPFINKVGKVTDWNNETTTPAAVLTRISNNMENISFKYPEFFSTFKLKPFLKVSSTRQLLQQICWATCCGIDTTYSNEIQFIPLLPESNTIELTFSNTDERILTTELSKGEKYSTIIIEEPAYTKNDTTETLGTVNITKESTKAILTTDYPVCVSSFYPVPGASVIFDNSPYHCELSTVLPGTYDIIGYKYKEYKNTTELSTKNKKGKTLTISNQKLFPVDTSLKFKQLIKWYENNNTVKATIVDDYSEIRLGMIIKLQLEDNSFFTGVITSIERTNISTYHIVNIEVHEWN